MQQSIEIIPVAKPATQAAPTIFIPRGFSPRQRRPLEVNYDSGLIATGQLRVTLQLFNSILDLWVLLGGRRSYDVPPPSLSKDDERYPGKDPRYGSLKPHEIPVTESLNDVVTRFLPYWNGAITPALREGQRVLIVAHGNSLRGLIKFLDGISDEKIIEVNIPTGLPLVYELDDDLAPRQSYYLGDQEKIEQAIKG